MPSEYGISKHPCFCFMKQKRQRIAKSLNNIGDLEVNNKIYNENDPIRLDELTKMFGEFKAVNNLKFSIK